MKKIYALAFTLFAALTSVAQTSTLCNFDFNSGSSLPVSASSTASNITASVNGTEANAAYDGTATGSGAFIQNTTPGSALSMANSSGNNTAYWTLTLGGSALNTYMAYHIYFQCEHSSAGATAITVSYSTNGSTFTAISQTIAPGLNNTFTEAFVDLSTINALNGASSIYLRFAASGASGAGTLRMDNLQVQGSLSPFETNGSSITFNGAVTAPTLTVTGDAKFNGNLTATGLTATSTNLTIANPAIFSSTIKSTSLAGTGSRILLTDANGLISPLAEGTSSQVLFGNGTWESLPAQVIQTSGSNAYFSGGNLGIGNTNPQVPLDVIGDAHIRGNTAITGAVSVSSLGGNSGDVFVTVDSAGNLKVLPIAPGPGAFCGVTTPWMIGGNTLGSAGGAIGTCNERDLIMKANGTDYMWLKTNGRLGIGTSTPGAQLDITASGANVGLNITSGTSAALNINNSFGSIFNVTANGNVGIGNASPVAQLDIFVFGTNAAFNITGNGAGSIFNVANDGSLTVGGNASINGAGGLTIPAIANTAAGTSYSSVLVDNTGKLVSGASVAGVAGSSWVLGGNSGVGTNGILGTTGASTDLILVAGVTPAGIVADRIHINGTTGNVGVNMDPNAPTPYKMLTVNGDVSFANYFVPNSLNGNPGNGISGLEILGNNQVPTCRGITTDSDPNGDFNFYINGFQGFNGASPSEFNFKRNLGGTIKNLMTLDASGRLILGSLSTDQNKPALNTSHASALLMVEGESISQAHYVTQNGWADFVFDKKYTLMPLNEVENFYQKNHHLPNVPSEKEMKQNGNNLGETDTVLLRKIEELTLYLVQQQKEIEALKEELKNKK